MTAPRLNPALTGQEGAEAALLGAALGGRLPHAWLLTGPRGIGKATLAFRFARFLLAGQAESSLFGAPRTLAVAETDPVFRRVASGGHPDFLTIERGFDEKRGRLKTEIVVEDVRGIGAFLSLTPAEGGWRVVVIDAADDMNRNAANAVLKVLEEPPQRAVMILVSHAPGRLLPTIRSRCRRLALRPLAAEEVAALLGRYRPELEPEAAAGLARLAEGSIGRALGLAEQGGLDLYREMIAQLSAVPKLDLPALHQWADKLARPQSEEAFDTVQDLLGWWLGRVVRAGAGVAWEEAVPGEAALAAQLCRTAAPESWIEIWEGNTERLLRADTLNLDRKQVVLNAFLALEAVARS